MDKLVTTIQATEQFNDLIDLLLNFLHLEMLKSNFLAVVHIKSDVLRSLLELIHKVLESLVSCLLEPHIVGERGGNKLINLILKLEQLAYHLKRLGLQIS